MRIYRETIQLPASAQNAVVALGNFDGLHLGHRKVLHTAATLAKELNRPLAVMSFEPHPRRLFNPSLPPLRIVPLREKLNLLRDAGVEILFLQRFTRAFSQLTAVKFVEEVLCTQLRISAVVTGDDFIFGYQRSGNTALLQQMGKEKGFQAIAVPPHHSDENVSSSSRIRNALQHGKIEDAAIILGRPYSLSGRIISGDRRGRKWGFPTANLQPGKIFLPAYGIYAVRLITQKNEKIYNGVASFGIRPMYAVENPLLEAHLFDVSPNLYGQRVEVQLLHYLRPEIKFDDEHALRQQIEADCITARQWLAAHA